MPTSRALLLRAVRTSYRSYTRYKLPRRPSVAHHHLLSVDLYVKFRTADTHLKYLGLNTAVKDAEWGLYTNERRHKFKCSLFNCSAHSTPAQDFRVFSEYGYHLAYPGTFEEVPGGPIFLSYTHLADSNRPQRSARRTVSLSTSRRCERLLEGRVGDQDFAARPACP